jgi:hypothetical protein
LKRGQKPKEWRGERRGLTLARIILRHNKNFRGGIKKGKKLYCDMDPHMISGNLGWVGLSLVSFVG